MSWHFEKCCRGEVILVESWSGCALSGLVEEGYHSTNPYHNAIHAADVTQAMHCFLQENKVTELERRVGLVTLSVLIRVLVVSDAFEPGTDRDCFVADRGHDPRPGPSWRQPAVPCGHVKPLGISLQGIT